VFCVITLSFTFLFKYVFLSSIRFSVEVYFSNMWYQRIESEKFNGQNFELWKLKIEDLLVD
jgi:hypothetical protein